MIKIDVTKAELWKQYIKLSNCPSLGLVFPDWILKKITEFNLADSVIIKASLVGERQMLYFFNILINFGIRTVDREWVNSILDVSIIKTHLSWTYFAPGTVVCSAYRCHSSWDPVKYVLFHKVRHKHCSLSG